MIKHKFLKVEGIVNALPAIADRFVKAGVKHCGADDLDSAIEWIKQD